MANRTEVLGLEEVLKSLGRLEPEMKRKALLAGSRAGSGVFKRSIVSKVPIKTGSLKRSIGVRAMKKSLKDIVGSMVVIRTGGARTKKQKSLGGDPWYWFLQEYGYFAGGRFRKRLGNKTRRGYDGPKLDANRGLTRDAFRARNKRTRKKTPGKFFVKKSYDSKKDSVMKAYESRIAKFVDKYRGR